MCFSYACHLLKVNIGIDDKMNISAVRNIILLVFLLSGCTAYVTKENSTDFETWELCTLLYNPHSLYSNWISDEEENRVIRAELEKRGFISKDSCSIESIAKAKCDSLGLKEGTNDYAKCRLDVEYHVEEMKQMKKSAREAKEAAAVIQYQQINDSYQSQPQPTFEPVWKP